MRIKFTLLALIITCGLTSFSLIGCGDKDVDTAEEAEDLETEASDEPADEEETEEEGEAQ